MCYKFKGNIKLWNSNEIKKTVNYLDNSIISEKLHYLNIYIDINY